MSKGVVRRKLIVLGDGACGKTCLRMVFARGNFPFEYKPTVFDNYVSQLQVKHTLVELCLWDLSGQEEYAHVRRLQYTGTDVVLICFAIDSRVSFDNVLAHWRLEVRESCPGVPVILVGTKGDLREDQQLAKKDQEMITQQEAQEMANKIGALTYIECSAKAEHNVSEVFLTATKATLKKKTNSKLDRRKCNIL